MEYSCFPMLLVSTVQQSESANSFTSWTKDSFATPWTVVCQAPLSMDFPGKNTVVGCHFLLQGIFRTQALNSGLLQFGWTLYHLSHQGLPKSLFPPGLEPGTLRVSGECDSHYTTETSGLKCHMKDSGFYSVYGAIRDILA